MRLSLIFLVMIVLVSAAVLATPAPAQLNPSTACRESFQNGQELFAEPQDVQMALFEPDCYAWRLFVALNWPAEQNSCKPDQARTLGAPGQVVWERWILKQDVYLKDAVPPMTWDTNCQDPTVAKTLEPTAQFLAATESLPESIADQDQLFASKITPMFLRPENEISNNNDEEVRVNEAAHAFIVNQKLYSLTEQRRLAGERQDQIEFPLAAKEIKAHWIRLDNESDYERYHTGTDDEGVVFGLVALHVTTKDLPKWFWASWEHVDNEERWPTAHPEQFAGWSVRPRDRFACEGEELGCARPPRGIGLEGTKWNNYILKATQTDWVDEFGAPTVVVNSKIEGGFIQSKSSCISCHALAMIGDKSGPMPFMIIDNRVPVEPPYGRVANFVGVVERHNWLSRGANPGASHEFLQLDFVWSLRNACPEPSDTNRLSLSHCR